MSLGTRTDPFPGYNFQVSLMDAGTTVGSLISTTLSILGADPTAGFQECSGLEGSLNVETYEEGGNNGFIHQFRTRMQWTPIVLKRGITANDDLFKWFYGFVEGKGPRRTGLITLCDHDRSREITWGFKDGLPTRYSGPAMNAQVSEVAVESIEITPHGLYTLPGGEGLIGAAASALDAIF